jgi:hypothetical protein
MRSRVDPSRHAALNDQTAGRKIDGETNGHPGSVRSRVAGADNGYAGLGKQFDSAAHIKDEGWIGNLLQTRGVGRVVE